jgi:hypothetical protein
MCGWLDQRRLALRRARGGHVPVRASDGDVGEFRGGAWEIGLLRGDAVVIGGEQVIGSRAAAIADPAGGATVDNEARTAIDAILDALREHGLIEI